MQSQNQRAILLLLFLYGCCASAATFRVATYNVENYLNRPTESRHFVKSAAAKAKIRQNIETVKPDVLALEEMGTTSALLELRASLKAEGCNFPFWDRITGVDTNIHIAVLSKFPIIARYPHTNDTFLLDGRRFHVERGFDDVKIQVAKNFTFTLIAAHLKSRLSVPYADQAEERFCEAKVLRRIINRHFRTNPDAKLIVLGDFNDMQNSNPIKEIIGRGRFKLFDTRPAERNGDNAPSRNPHYPPRRVTWTDYYGMEDTYSRIDYILLNPAMKRYWRADETYIPTIPNWGVGSDHRPIVAGFSTDSN